jgi:hemoglobin
MFKSAVAGLAVCWACSMSLAQAPPPGFPAPPPGTVVPPGFVPAPPPGYYAPPGYNPPVGVVRPMPVPAPIVAPAPVVAVFAPAHRSNYNPRVDFPPFTMVPDFTVFERGMAPPTTFERTTPRTTERTLYERLGGENAIRAVIDDFVARTAANPKVNFTRKGMPAEWKATPEAMDRLKKMLVDLTGMATGGPQRYTGKDLKESHRDMRITQDEFDATVADLKASLDKFNVGAREQEELLAIVRSKAGDIVEKKRN